MLVGEYSAQAVILSIGFHFFYQYALVAVCLFEPREMLNAEVTALSSVAPNYSRWESILTAFIKE